MSTDYKILWIIRSHCGIKMAILDPHASVIKNIQRLLVDFFFGQDNMDLEHQCCIYLSMKVAKDHCF